MAQNDGDVKIVIQADPLVQAENTKLKQDLAKRDQEISRLKENVVDLTSQLQNSVETAERLTSELNEAQSASGIKAVRQELERFQESARTGVREFRAFIEAVNLKDVRGFTPDQLLEYSNKIREGAMTVGQAITDVRTRFAGELQGSIGASGGTFDSQILQNFNASLSSISDSLTTIINKLVQFEDEGVKAIGGVGEVAGGGGGGGSLDLLFERISEAAHNMTPDVREAMGAIKDLFAAMNSITSTSDTKLLQISQSFGNIAKLSSSSFSKGSVANIINLANSLQRLGEEGGDLKLSFSGLEKLAAPIKGVEGGGFKLSSTLKYLNEYLLPFAENVKVDKLQKLSSVDLSNFSNIKIDKSSLQSITDMCKAMDEMTKTMRVAFAEEQKRNVSTAKKTADETAEIKKKNEAMVEALKLIDQYNKDIEKFRETPTQDNSLQGLKNQSGMLSKWIDDLKRGNISLDEFKRRMYDLGPAHERMLNNLRESDRAAKAQAKSQEEANKAAESAKNAFDKEWVSTTQEYEKALNGANERLTELEKAKAKYASGDNLTQDQQALINQGNAMTEIIARFKDGKISTADFKAELALLGAQVTETIEKLKALEAANKAQASAAAGKAKQDAADTKTYADSIEKALRLLETLNTAKEKYVTDPSQDKNQQYLVNQTEGLKLWIDQFKAGAITADEFTKRITLLGARSQETISKLKMSAATNKEQENAQKEENKALDEAAKLLEKISGARSKYNSLSAKQKEAGGFGDLEKQAEAVNRAIANFQNTKDIGAFKREIAGISKQFDGTKKSLDGVDKAQAGLFGKMGADIKRMASYYLSFYMILRRTIQQVRQMISTAVELDSAMGQLKIVTQDTTSAYERYLKAVASTSKEIGASMKDMIDATTTYARLGYSLDESSILAKYTSMLQRVGDIDSSEAQDAITSIMKAFNDVSIDNIESVMDKLVVTGNNFPISVSQIAEGMTNASSALSAAGNSFEESVALLMSANASLQNASKASTGLRTLAARIRNTKAELDDLGESLETSKYEEIVDALTKHNVALVDAAGEYRSTYDIVKDIAAQWDKMTSMEQAALATQLAGTRQQNVFYSLINNFKSAEDAMSAMQDSTGELSTAYGTYMDTIEAHTNQFKATFQELSRQIITSDLAKSVVDIGVKLLNLVSTIAKLIDKLGGLQSILYTIGSIGIIKGIDKIATAFSKIGSLFAAGKATEFLSSAPGKLKLLAGAILLVVGIIRKHKSDVTKANQEMIQSAKVASEDIKTMQEAYEAYKLADTAYSSGVGTKEDLTNATNDLLVSLGYEKDQISALIAEYGSLENAMDRVSEKKLQEMIDGIEAAKTEASKTLPSDMNVFSIGSITDENNIKVAMDARYSAEHTALEEEVKLLEARRSALAILGQYDSSVLAQLESVDKELERKRAGLEESVDFADKLNEAMSRGFVDFGSEITFETLQQKLDFLQTLKDRMLSEVNEDFSMAELEATDIWQKTVDGIDYITKYIEENWSEYNNLVNTELGHAVDSLYRRAMDGLLGGDLKTPETIEEFNMLVDLLYNTGMSEGSIITAAGDDADDLREKIENILKLRPDIEAIFTNPEGPTQGSKYSNLIKRVPTENEEGDQPKVTDSLEKLQKQYELVAEAEKDMRESGTLSAGTLKKLSDASDHYAECIYQEGNAIKLNTELWREYAARDMSDSVESIENEYKALDQERIRLENRKAELEQMSQADDSWRSEISKVNADLEENQRRIEKILPLYELASNIQPMIDAISAPNERIANDIKQTQAEMDAIQKQMDMLDDAKEKIESYNRLVEQADAEKVRISNMGGAEDIERRYDSYTKEIEKLEQRRQVLQDMGQTDFTKIDSELERHQRLLAALQPYYDMIKNKGPFSDDAIAKAYREATEAAAEHGYTVESLMSKYGELSGDLSEAQSHLDSLTNASDAFVAATSAYEDFGRIADIANGVNDSLETLANLQEKVGNSFTMALNDALEFASVYPEIMNDAEVTADGQIKLNEDVVNSFIEGKEAEIKGAVDAEIQKLEADKAVLTAKRDFAQAQLEMAKQVADGEAGVSLEEAMYRIELGNQLTQALIEAGMDEAEAYRLATQAMSGDFSAFDQTALNVAQNVLNNLDSSAAGAATSISTNMSNAQRSIAQVASQAHESARAIQGIARGAVEGSSSIIGGRNDGTRVGGGAMALADVVNSPESFNYQAKKLDLGKFMSELATDITSYSSAISQIDGQIATLQALRNKSLDKYKTSGKNNSGGGGGNGNGGGGNGDKDKGKEESGEYFDWVEVKIKRLEEAIERLDTVANRTYLHWDKRNTALANEIKKITSEINARRVAYETYMAAANSVGLSSKWKKKVQNGAFSIDEIKSEKTREKIKLYQEYYEKAVEENQAILDLEDDRAAKYRERFDNYITRYEEFLAVIEHKKNMLDSAIERSEANGLVVSTKYYESLQQHEEENIELLEKERTKLLNWLSKAMANGIIEKGSEEWYDMCQQIDEVTESIAEARTQTIEYANSIRQIRWDIFDMIQSKISGIVDETGFLINLMKDDTLYEDNGQLTDRGLATMGLYGMNYNTYMVQAKKYADEISALNEEISNDPYNQDLINRREELLKLQRESILSANDEKQSIKGLVKDGIEKELDSIKKLIDSYNEAADAQKNMYEYQKKVSEQTEEIAKIQKQLAAYEGDNSEENRTRLQRLRKQLSDAQKNLEETQYDKYLSDQKTMFDDLYEQYSDLLNKRLDDIDTLISDMIDTINSSVSKIEDVLVEEANSVGYTLSESIRTTWNNALSETEPVLIDIKEGIVSAITDGNTTLGDALNEIDLHIQNMLEYIDKRAEEENKEIENSTATKTNEANTKVTTPKTTTVPKDDNKKKSSDKKDTTTKDNKSKTRTTKENYGVALAIWEGTYGWGSGDTRKKRLKAKGFDPSKIQSIVNKIGKDGYIHNGTWKGKYYGITSLKPYHYNKFALGSKKIGYSQYAWTQENGTEMIIRPSDGAVLTPLAYGDSVLSSKASKNLWEIANTPSKFIHDNLDNLLNVPQNSSAAGNYTQNFESVVFSMPSVKNYEEMLRQMQRDRNFERLIQSMSVDVLNGKSPLNKTKAIK